MSATGGKEGGKRRCSLLLRPSSRTTSVSHGGPRGAHQRSRQTTSVLGCHSRRSLGGSKVLEKNVVQTPRQAVRVFDEVNNDVTPQPLYQADPGAVQPMLFVDEMSVGSASDQPTATGSFTLPFSRSVFGSSRISSQSTTESVDDEDMFSKRDIPLSFPDVKVKKDTEKEQVTEDMLKDITEVFISETDTFSLLDMPSTFVCVDADEAEATIARNHQYEEVCRVSRDKHVERTVQTLTGTTKNKHVQSNGLMVVDADVCMSTATNVTVCDMYEPLSDAEQEETAGICNPVKTDHSEGVTDSSRGADRSVSVGSTATTVSASGSLKEVEVKALNAETQWKLIMLSDKFQLCLQTVERSILQNSFHPQLAAYRQLPVLGDPECPVKNEMVEQRTGGTDGGPSLQCLWVFSCELSRGRSVSCMTWNRKNPDLLAVGHGEFDSGNQKPGLVSCWSIKNLKWPEHVIHCDSAVTALDFSANSPSQLAVGTHDGSITIHSVHSQDNRSRGVSSRESPNRHLGPVWQLRWTQQQVSSTGEEKVEALLSVGADGRISKWFFFKDGLDCIDLMKLRRIQNTETQTGGKRTEMMTESVLTALTPGLCFDFHPTDSSIYLTGTWEGLIHQCSCSNSQQFLETYRKHFCPVNCVAWSPFNPDVFLSCSSDWTIQLWKQHHLKPVLGFTSAQKAFYDIKWSPKWPTVFGAVTEGQLEIWDLSSSILDPVIVQPAAPGVRMTSLLFSSQADCVVVGDTDGHVTVYQLKNLSVGEQSQVDVLEDLICSAASR
ncbi:dynein intermediate chain 4, axonemal isoform X1 [Simochromis diagramma]|uniref:dynein intermediate chain 4, axonemal isoform X1 n=1 Tax=Simochromis diagramma TaxID=43689 RepID=UPI001A7EC4F7|nr:dynein intermediate chain 4, axonemal isoform X1 [Simochromis diagramma]XP_039900891.1 dynein intermediate chain 4, axonemal isoform X1 [Simochromis diagramma]